MGMFSWTEKSPAVLQGGGVVGPDERLPWGQTGLMGVQHVVAMFGSTVLAPLLMGFDPNLAVLMSGIGTLVFFLVTGGKVPSYLGSSFAESPPGCEWRILTRRRRPRTCQMGVCRRLVFGCRPISGTQSLIRGSVTRPRAGDGDNRKGLYASCHLTLWTRRRRWRWRWQAPLTKSFLESRPPSAHRHPHRAKPNSPA